MAAARNLEERRRVAALCVRLVLKSAAEQRNANGGVVGVRAKARAQRRVSGRRGSWRRGGMAAAASFRCQQRRGASGRATRRRRQLTAILAVAAAKVADGGRRRVDTGAGGRRARRRDGACFPCCAALSIHTRALCMHLFCLARVLPVYNLPRVGRDVSPWRTLTIRAHRAGSFACLRVCHLPRHFATQQNWWRRRGRRASRQAASRLPGWRMRRRQTPSSGRLLWARGRRTLIEMRGRRRAWRALALRRLSESGI